MVAQHYCYLCNCAMDNEWICTPCVNARDPFIHGVFNNLPSRHSPLDPLPQSVIAIFGNCILDPDLYLPEGI